MKQLPRLCIPALLVLCLVAPTAGAATASHSATVPVTATDWTQSLTFPKFDPALGALMGISFAVRTDLVSTFRYENLSTSASCTSRDSSKATVELQRPDASAITSTIAAREYGQTMPAFDGTIDFGGTSGYTAADLATSASATRVVTAPADLALFTGPGSIVLPCRAVGRSFTSENCGNGIHGIGTRAGAYVVVTYSYDTATSATRGSWGRIKILYR